MSLQSVWAGIPISWKVEGKSILHTFIAAVGVELLFQLQGANLSFSQGFLLALGSAVLRSGIKAVLELLYVQFGKKGEASPDKSS